MTWQTTIDCPNYQKWLRLSFVAYSPRARPIPGLDGALPIRLPPNSTPEARWEKPKVCCARVAAREAEHTSWTYHVGNAALNGFAGAVIGIFVTAKEGIITSTSGSLGGIVYAFAETSGRQED